MMNHRFGAGLLLGLSSLAFAAAHVLAASDLAPPFRVQVGDKPVDASVGHAAPFVMDFDGDGLPDLLMGQYSDCQLRIYRNVGTKAEPKFKAFAYFKAGGREIRLPGG
jgi:hypothetical protein